MRLKIIAYNILTGLCDWDFGDKMPVVNKERLSFAKKLIKQENPDILCLTEALFSIKNYRGVYMDYQKIFGYPYVDVRESNIILSKYPIIISKGLNKKGKNSGMVLVCKIKLKHHIISIGIIHPSVYANENNRVKLVKRLFEEEKHINIICGDFNSISLKDNYSKKFAENFKRKVILKDKNISKKLADKIINDMFNPKVIKYIESKDLVDTYKLKNKEFDYTVPTDFGNKDKSTGIRIDFIFVSKNIKVLSSGIVKNNLSELASDHYPVFAVLNI